MTRLVRLSTEPQFLEAPRDRQRLKKAVRLNSLKILAEQEQKAGFREASPNAPRFLHRGRSWQGLDFFEV